MGPEFQPEGEQPRSLTPEEVVEIREKVRNANLAEVYMSRQEEIWPDGTGKTIRWPDGGEVRILFDDKPGEVA